MPLSDRDFISPESSSLESPSSPSSPQAFTHCLMEDERQAGHRAVEQLSAESIEMSAVTSSDEGCDAISQEEEWKTYDTPDKGDIRDCDNSGDRNNDNDDDNDDNIIIDRQLAHSERIDKLPERHVKFATNLNENNEIHTTSEHINNNSTEPPIAEHSGARTPGITMVLPPSRSRVSLQTDGSHDLVLRAEVSGIQVEEEFEGRGYSQSFTSIGSCGSLEERAETGSPFQGSGHIIIEDGQHEVKEISQESDSEEGEECCCSGSARGFKKCGLCLCDCGRQTWKLFRKTPYRKCAARTCSKKTLKSRLPITSWLPKYKLGYLHIDLISGLTAGLLLLSQGIAYAKIVELPTEYGLYSCIMGCFIYMLFGTAKDVSVGPSAITSLMASQFAIAPVADDPTYAIILSFIGGLVQIAMSFLKLGFVVVYISQPVINGFTQAAAVTTIIGQIPTLLGLHGIPRPLPQKVYWIFKKLSETNAWDFLMGLSCGIFLYVMKKLKTAKFCKVCKTNRILRLLKYIFWIVCTARSAIAMILSGGAVAIFFFYGLEPFSRNKNVPAGLPHFRAPSFSLSAGNETQSTQQIFQSLGLGLFVVPLISLMETVAIGKSFARKNGYSIDANQELLSLGVSNFLGSFVSSFPVSSSFSRGSMNHQTGVKTTGSSIYAGVLVLLTLAFLTPMLNYIPNSALASIIIMSLIELIDLTPLVDIWNIKKLDLIPWFLTFILSILLGIETGLFVGIIFSLCIILYPASKPKMKYHSLADIALLTLDQGLTFPSVDYFKSHISSAVGLLQKKISVADTRSVILDFRHISQIDYSTVQGVLELAEDFHYQKRTLIVCKLREKIQKVFQRTENKYFRYTATVNEAIEIIQEENTRQGRTDEGGAARISRAPDADTQYDETARSICTGFTAVTLSSDNENESVETEETQGQDNYSFHF